MVVQGMARYGTLSSHFSLSYNRPGDYENAHTHMSRVSSTHEGFLDDPAYARVQDWTRGLPPPTRGHHHVATSNMAASPMSPPSAPRHYSPQGMEFGVYLM